MTPYEIMLSESQERMLLVVERGREHEVEAVFEKWDLHAVKVGEVTDGTRLQIHERGTLVADVPEPRAHRRSPGLPPADAARAAWQMQRQDVADLVRPDDRAGRSIALIASPTIASKRWVSAVRPHRRHQHHRRPGMSAGVVASRNQPRAGDVGRRQRPVLLSRSLHEARWRSPRRAQRRVRGGEPIGATNNLNFGNPERPGDHVADRRGRRGHRRRLPRARHADYRRQRQPVQRDRRPAIFPTPVLGVVGLLEDASKTRRRGRSSASAPTSFLLARIAASWAAERIPGDRAQVCRGRPGDRPGSAKRRCRPV